MFKHAKVFLLGAALSGCGSTDFNGGDGGLEKALGKTTNDDRSYNSEDATAGVDPNDPEAVANATYDPGTRVDDGGITTDPSFGLDESVVFGDDKVFRVGDGKAGGSSCKDSISAHEISGTTYHFNFTVVNPDTKVEIKIENICGIDLSNASTAKLIGSDGVAAQSSTLKPGQARMEFATTNLNAGEFSIQIKTASPSRGRWRGHLDDFMVGKIHIYANKKLIPGAVRAE